MNKKNFFFNDLEWSDNLLNFIGLPRPFFNISKDRQKQSSPYKLVLKNNLYLHKKVPIPWQSIPFFTENRLLGLNQKNEALVHKEGRCGYCGIKFIDTDECSRWKVVDPNQNDTTGPRVFSDTYPLHPECMKQARIFCPFMRQRKDSEFENGIYKDLLQNFIDTTPNLPII